MWSRVPRYSHLIWSQNSDVFGLSDLCSRATTPKTYPELRAFIEKERPDWLQALVPRRINAPSEYWPQKVLALATIQAALSNQVMQDAGLKPDATFVMVECQTGHLLQFDVPTFYVSKELLAASARTDLLDNTFLDAVTFPFPASVFMFPKGTIRHPSEGECPYIVVSRVAKGQVFSTSTQGRDLYNYRCR